MKYMIVVDVQNDFITGPLGNAECVAAANRIAQDLHKFADNETVLLYTMDTHYEDNYFNTIEGQKLPIPHCFEGTPGWEIVSAVNEAGNCFGFLRPDVIPFAYHGVVKKETFGSLDLINAIYAMEDEDPDMKVDEITIFGVCTDICVISNAMLLKTSFPNVPIKVIEKYCAGVTIESHNRALEAMKMCHIEII